MSRCLLMMILTGLTQFANAQFMKVIDPDGFVNIRKEPNVQSEIIGTVNAHDVVYHVEADESTGNWISIFYGQNNEEIYGFIHASRLKAISLSDDIPLVETGELNWYFIRKKDQTFLANIRVEIDFEMSSLDTELELDKDGNFILNKEHVWGLFDPEVKTNKYKTIQVDINGKNVNVPAKELEGLFSVRSDFKDDKHLPVEISYDQGDDTLYIRSLNGDASYSYDLLFIFEKGMFKKKLIYIPF